MGLRRNGTDLSRLSILLNDLLDHFEFLAQEEETALYDDEISELSWAIEFVGDLLSEREKE